VRKRKHACACFDCELSQQRAEKADAHDRDSLTGTNLCALENIHRAAKRLCGKRGLFESRRQLDHFGRACEVVLRKRMRRQERHTVTARESGHAFAHCIDASPRLVSRRARLKWIVKPTVSFPNRKIGLANAATFDLNPQLTSSATRSARVNPVTPSPTASTRPHASCP